MWLQVKVTAVYTKEKLNERESISHACGHYIMSCFEYISFYGAQTGKKMKKQYTTINYGYTPSILYPW
jgi:hypothetical protein